ncbi:MAG: sensor histidine kinase [Actinomycetota bacterium]|nr:sensor histidine kinase [Actinomycetota bacterium]
MRSLASWLLCSVLGILIAAAVVGGILEVRQTARTLDQQYEERARVAAAVVATIPEIRSAVTVADRDRQLQPLASRLQASAGAAYVVITNVHGIRYSHPNPALIGLPLEEPVAALDGRTHVGIDNGSLGRSANAKAPIFSASGSVIGQVSVGILETTVAAQLWVQIRAITLYLIIALLVGAMVALLVARALKRKTFGLELPEISSLLQEREAMLHGIREGVIGFDAKGRVSLINDEARNLLGLARQSVGEPLNESLTEGRLRDVLIGTEPGQDQVVLTDDSLLVVNRRPVVIAGRPVGSIVTLRDRTELEGLMRELDATTGLANALRAQEHEFANRLHVIGGLLGLQEVEEARLYLDTVAAGHTGKAEDLRSRISPPAIAALLLAKLSVAVERDIELELTDESRLDISAGPDSQTVMTVLANLIDNAIDAVSEQPLPRRVTVTITEGDRLRLEVSDNGPGVPQCDVQRIFSDGFSTKASRGDRRRGIGLALVRRLLNRRGGTIELTPGDGACFTVELPAAAVTR